MVGAMKLVKLVFVYWLLLERRLLEDDLLDLHMWEKVHSPRVRFSKKAIILSVFVSPTRIHLLRLT